MNKLALYIISFYRNHISGTLGRGKCRYTPTCSSYSYEAFSRYCFSTALALSLWRIIRCNPWSKGGKDPLRS